MKNILLEEDSRIEFAQNEIKYINNLASDFKKIRPKILSVGLGGGFAEKMMSNKYEKYGIEPDNKAAELASKYVNKIFNCTFEEVNFENSFFDIVFAHHVIEHIENPINLLKRLMVT